MINANEEVMNSSKNKNGKGRIREFLGDLLGEFGAGLAGTTGPLSARGLGLPEAEFMTPGQLQQLMMLPQRKEQTLLTQENISTAPWRRALLHAHTRKAIADSELSRKAAGV